MRLSPKAPYSCIILDDDPLSVNILEHFVFLIDNLALKASFTDPVDATAAFLNIEKIDFLFVDIEMNVSGIDIARMLRDKVAYVIFVTSHVDYALKAFSHGDRYLVKPLDFDKFKSTVNEIIFSENKGNKQKV